MKIRRSFLLLGGLFGVSGVILGAMGAHALKEVLSEDSLNSFNTGVKYQIYHAILLLILSFMSTEMKDGTVKASYWLILLGIICFSGSIYLLNLGPVIGLDFRFLGPVTPIGGLMLISAWVLLVFEGLRKRT